MLDFFLTVLLFFMVVAAMGSLLFASNRVPFIVWNFFWYWILGNVAIKVFEDPQAGWLGIGFGIAYLLRARNSTPPAFVFKTGGWGQGMRPPQSARAPGPMRTASGPDVIDAEVIDVQSTER